MDYEIGSIADLISGNHTPNRPKVLKKPLTPVKQPPVVNVTPRDDSKSKPRTPKIAFTPEIPSKTPSKLKDLDRSHLESPKSVPPKKRKSKLFNNFQFLSQIPDYSSGSDNDRPQEEYDGSDNEFTVDQPKKKKFDKTNAKMVVKEYYEGKIEECNLKETKSKKGNSESAFSNESSTTKSEKKLKKQKDKGDTENICDKVNGSEVSKKTKLNNELVDAMPENSDAEVTKMKKKKQKKTKETELMENSKENFDEIEKIGANTTPEDGGTSVTKKKKKRSKETELVENGDDNVEEPENVDTAEDIEPVQESDDENDENLTEYQKSAKRRVKQQTQRDEKFDDEELARTLFIGNIPVALLKKNYEKVLRNKFTPYGLIQSVRIRNIPIVDFKTRPKVALIEKKFHPERATAIAYIKYAKAASVEKALVENNSLIENNHIRVDRCQKGKPAIDKRKTLFLGNLPFSVEEEAIREVFEKCGAISSIRVVRDKKTQIGKGIGFVNFEKSDGVEIALTMGEEDLQINGKTVRVKRYTTNSNEQEKKENPHFRENKVVGKRYQKFNQPPPREQQFYGKKRDSQGNKIRKRDLGGGDLNKHRKRESNNEQNLGEENFTPVKKFKPNIDQTESYSNDEPIDQGNTVGSENRSDGYKTKREKGNLDFKGLIAQKKKKMKLSKGILQKKKISKILLQHQKIPK